MALLVQRLSKLPTTLCVTRLLLRDSLVRSRSSRRCFLPVTPAAAAVRPYSSERRIKRELVLSPRPQDIWLQMRNLYHYFLIRVFYDPEFSLEEFAKGAMQAFNHVSKILSTCEFPALKGLVAKEMVEKLEEQCNLLPENHRAALLAEPGKVGQMNLRNIVLDYSGNGRTFVTIDVVFVYLSSVHVSSEASQRLMNLAMPNEMKEKITAKSLLTAHYEFHREFTRGVKADWTITMIGLDELLSCDTNK